MTSEPLAPGQSARSSTSRDALVALVGNPNAGKTTLFNALTGLRAKTANFPGTTIERRVGRTRLGGRKAQLLDLPGLYSLSSQTPEERLAREALLGELPGQPQPDAVVLLVDATQLERNLYLASQVLELGLPTVVALNMVDLAKRSSIEIDTDRLATELGCPVVPVVARSGSGVDQLRHAIEAFVDRPHLHVLEEGADSLSECAGCPYKARFDWAEEVGSKCTVSQPATRGARTDRIDSVLTHPQIGVAAFLAVVFGVFALIFWIAEYPMGWIDQGFASAGALLNGWLPEGDLRSLLVEGVIGGVGGVLVFLPQICILFFFLALLEDTGYLARAAFVMDRLMRRVGLPGKAFVPMISAHACAIPAIMSSRVIEDRRDRLVTILVLPLFSCSARIPVYAMVTALLFPARPVLAAATFTAAYTLGIVAALVMAFAFKRTILPGESRPLVLELPSYKLPSLRSALLATWDRARIFIRRAGSIILTVSIVLWALSTYPKSEAPAEVVTLEQQAAEMAAAGHENQATELRRSAGQISGQHALSRSFAGRLGRAIEPAIEPLGFDWQIGVGILSSFAAREVIVSTLAVVYGVGGADVDENPSSLYDALRAATRSDGSPVYTTATSVALLIFYVLAMQCLSTQAVTRRETGGWRWPVFQLGYMTVLAYVATLIVYQSLRALGIA
jgi:ferrous iron transport protein B